MVISGALGIAAMMSTANLEMALTQDRLPPPNPHYRPYPITSSHCRSCGSTDISIVFKGGRDYCLCRHCGGRDCEIEKAA